MEDAQREEYRQTVNWHYDVHDLNFLYAFFYISGANRLSGSHEVIKKSHKKKMFFKHLVGSVIQSDYDLRNYYDNEKFYLIGNPVKHSLSPKIFSIFAEETGKKMEFSTLAVKSNNLSDTIEYLKITLSGS